MSTQPNDGGLAFPVSDRTTINGEFLHGHRGMSLRAYFAGQAMAGLLATNDFSALRVVAKTSVNAADALIAELNKTQQ